jgi:hypothetical protein
VDASEVRPVRPTEDALTPMQGSDEPAVLLFLGPSASPFETIGFLDKRRLNVATSRAQTLLVIVADFKAIGQAARRTEPEDVADMAALFERWGQEGVVWNARTTASQSTSVFQESEGYRKYTLDEWLELAGLRQ